MATPLLTTKLYIPPPRSNLVPRPRLIQRLDEGLRLGHKLVLISAPAGFGKTTLVSEWLYQSQVLVAPGQRGGVPGFQFPRVTGTGCAGRAGWISLDEGDNDPAQFWAYFVAALQRVQADIGETAPEMLRSSQPPPIKPLLTGLINEIAAVPDPFVLVLDDFHVISEQQIHDALLFILDNQPPQMHLVLSSRADPPWPLARLRARGQITELRAGDLRFTLKAVTVFLNDAMQLDLSPEEVAALDERTEGWIAGLQMAAVSMRGRQDRSDFVRAFTGSNRYVLDYLVEEVLQRQPDSVQTFLLQTSVLDRLSGPLCDAVLGSGESGIEGSERHSTLDTRFSGQQILEHLESHNLFLIPLDDRREWYRYHRLFADLLRKRLHHTQPEVVPDLHRRASVWYEYRAASLGDSGPMTSAIEHAFAAGDFERSADLIMQVSEATLGQTHVATFLNWVSRLPDDVVRARPTLSFYHAFALLLNGYPLDAVEARLQDVGRDMDFVDSRKAALGALIAMSQGDFSKAIELSQQTLQWLPEGDWYWRSLVTWILNLSRSEGSDLSSRSQALDEVVRMGQETGNPAVTVVALCYQADLCLRQGKLHKAKTLYERALASATDKGGRTLPVAGEAILGLGELYREWNDFETATRYLEEGLELTEQWRRIEALPGYFSLARVRQAQGDAEGAQDAIQKAMRLAEQFDAARWDDWLVALEQARLWLAQGNTGAAKRWVEERGLDTEIDPARPADEEDAVSQHLRKYKHLLLARVLLAQDRQEDALSLLESLQQQMEREGRTGMVIEILLLKALAFSQIPARGRTQEDVDQAITALERALSLAEPEGYVRLFIDEGARMGALLRQAATRGIAVDYVRQLLAALEGENEEERPSTEPLPSSLVPGLSSSLVEPLSERELEVLRLIAAGLSNREIAQDLIVAVSTVKTHVHNIYGKLGVAKRTQAVARARELNLL